MAKQTKSVEPQIADLCNRWMRDMGLDYKLEQEPLNEEIDKALAEYESKMGGRGGNRPDAKLLLTDRAGKHWPVLIEYKGHRDKLVKYDGQAHVANRNHKGDPHNRNIATFAVNGAVHYANALLHFTGYTDIIAIGVTGYLDPDVGTLRHEIGVYYVSKSNLGVGQKVSDYSDLSFLSPEHFGAFIEQVKQLSLTQRELETLREKREGEIAASLTKLNNDIYQNEKGIGESDRVYLVAASIIATLGIPDRVAPLDKSELKSSAELGNRDGDIITRKIQAFLKYKNLPEEKQQFMVNTLSNVLLQEQINKPEKGESQLRRIFTKIVDNLGIYYKIGLTTDFTGRLFNEMYSWLGFSQDKLNDVVLTPSYVATLLARLARVNKDSYVWDFATGSAGLLVAAMNEMLADAKRSITSPEDLAHKEADIKANQLLGIEILPGVYMLAVLNMILMGDGSSNILNRDSLKELDGRAAQFPADAFILNPPYSASGNGMVFVEKALSMMNRGYAAVIIQRSTGSGQAAEYNRRILTQSTLLASIKMPTDLFLGRSIVETYIYVFRVGEAHQPDDAVRFIDFTEDGYVRSNRKKASVNLKDVDHAAERYAELVDVVRYGEKKLHYIRPEDFFEGTIDPTSGADWNQSAPIDITPTLEDFKKTVSDYRAWEVSSLLKNLKLEDNRLGKIDTSLRAKLEGAQWEEFRIGDLFNIRPTQAYKLTKGELFSPDGRVPVVTNSSLNNGITGFSTLSPTEVGPMLTFSDTTTGECIFVQPRPFIGYPHIQGLYPLEQPDEWDYASLLFIAALMRKSASGRFSYGNKFTRDAARDIRVLLPCKGDRSIDFQTMRYIVAELEARHVVELEARQAAELEVYLSSTGLSDCTLSGEDDRALQALDSADGA